MFINTEELLVAYLRPLIADAGDISVEMPNTPPLPFILVTRVAAVDDKVTELATSSVSVFSNSRDHANDIARLVHSRMLALTPRIEVELSGVTVRVDRVRTIQGPAWADYQDENLERYVARYEVESRINSQPIET